MSRAVYVSTNFFVDRTPSGIRQTEARSAITHVELSNVKADQKAAINLARDLNGDGVKVLLHNYFFYPDEPFLLNLASAHAQVLRQSRDLCARAIELSAEVHAPFFAAHAGFALELPSDLLGKPEAQREFCRTHRESKAVPRAREIFCESVADLIAKGRYCGVEFLIENHIAGEKLGSEAAQASFLGLFSDEILDWASAIDGFGLLLDLGHLHCTARTMGFNPEKFCTTIGSFVRAFHLSDNNGRYDEHRPFNRSTWFLDFVKTRPEIPAILEFSISCLDELAAARKLLL